MIIQPSWKSDDGTKFQILSNKTKILRN